MNICRTRSFALFLFFNLKIGSKLKVNEDKEESLVNYHLSPPPPTLSSSGLYWLMQWVAVSRWESSEEKTLSFTKLNYEDNIENGPKIPGTDVTHPCLTEKGCTTGVSII